MLADTPWPKFRGNAQNTGLSPYATSHVDGKLLWSHTDPNSAIKLWTESSPVIGPDGTIYYATTHTETQGDDTDPDIGKGRLYAIRPDGTEKWGQPFTTGEGVYIPNPVDPAKGMWKSVQSTPAIASDGTIYFVALDSREVNPGVTVNGRLYAVNPDGSEKWQYDIEMSADVWSSPTIGEDGTIYVGSHDGFNGKLYAINPDKSEKWPPFTTGSDVCSSPAITSDGATIYVGSGDNNMYAIDAVDGSEKWRFSIPAPPNLPGANTIAPYVESSPAIGPDGTIYIGSGIKYIDAGGAILKLSGKLFAIDPDNHLDPLWSFPENDYLDGEIFSSPAIGPDGVIYVGISGGTDHNVYAINPDGSKKWHFPTTGDVASSPVVGADGTIYVSSTDHNLYAIHPDGINPDELEKWRFNVFCCGWDSSVAIGKHGTVYATNDKLYAFIPFANLGTLNGPNGSANAINYLGQVVGAMSSPTGAHDHAFLITPEHTDSDGIPDRWCRDTDDDGINDLMVDLGTLGGSGSGASAINNLGQIVGTSESNSGERAFLITPEDTDGDGVPDSWYRDSGGINDLMVELGTLGGSESVAHDINNLGQIVGESSTPSGEIHAFLIRPPGLMVDLGTLGGSGSIAYGINDLGQIVGESSTPSGEIHAFLIRPENPGLMMDLGTLGGRYSYAYAINNLGQIVGESETPSLGYGKRAFLITPEDTDGDGVPDSWYRDTEPPGGDGINDLMVNLGTIGDFESRADAINELGQIVGLSRHPYRAFLITPEDTDGDGVPDSWYRDTGGDGINVLMEELGTPDGLYYSTAWAIDNLGHVIGRIQIPDNPDNDSVLWLPPDNTPMGSNISVRPIDSRTGKRPVSVTFSDVTETGMTGLTIRSYGSSTPAGYQNVDPPAYYDIKTSAGFTGSMEICIDYGNMNVADEATLKLLHLKNGSWEEDPNQSLDTVNKKICATFDSLMAFAVFEPALDSDGDGIPDYIEKLVSPEGDPGISVLPEDAVVTRAELLDDGSIIITVSYMGAEITVILPPGTHTTGSEPIVLTGVPDPVEPEVQVLNAVLLPGTTKTITMPWPAPTQANKVIINDVPGATSVSLTSSDGSNVIAIPSEARQSNDRNVLNGDKTNWTVTNNGDGTITISGLANTAVGITARDFDRPPQNRLWIIVAAVLAVLAVGFAVYAYVRTHFDW